MFSIEVHRLARGEFVLVYRMVLSAIDYKFDEWAS